MNFDNLGNISPKQFADNFFGPEDERKEPCIGCGKVYYIIHHKDGLCHSCQQKGLPGRRKLLKRAKTKYLIYTSIYGVLFVATILAIIKYLPF